VELIEQSRSAGRHHDWNECSFGDQILNFRKPQPAKIGDLTRIYEQIFVWLVWDASIRDEHGTDSKLAREARHGA
jgi:hypothetical protein